MKVNWLTGAEGGREDIMVSVWLLHEESEAEIKTLTETDQQHLPHSVTFSAFNTETSNEGTTNPHWTAYSRNKTGTYTRCFDPFWTETGQWWGKLLFSQRSVHLKTYFNPHHLNVQRKVENEPFKTFRILMSKLSTNSVTCLENQLITSVIYFSLWKHILLLYHIKYLSKVLEDLSFQVISSIRW